MISDLSPAEILTIIDAVSTAVLAVITYYYAKEIGIIRKTGQNPSFCLESRVYIREENSANNISIRSISLHSHNLILINNVLPANDIQVDCSWGNKNSEAKNSFTSGSYIKKFYVMSLSTEVSAILDDVSIADIVNKGDSLLLTLTCKDARGETYPTKFDIDDSNN